MVISLLDISLTDALVGLEILTINTAKGSRSLFSIFRELDYYGERKWGGSILFVRVK